MDEEVNLMNKVLSQQNYKVLAKVSEGSYGEIFLVENKKTGLKYVLKALELEKLKKQSRIHEALIESLILRKLNHPGIIKIYETIQGQNYFSEILQNCPNGDLFKLMARINHDITLVKKKSEIMRFYLAQILQAICYLHEHKIIHRDLKPENIVIGQDLHLQLIDFGTALINNDDYISQIEKQSIKQLKNKDKQLVGSAHYLSPEALRFKYTEKSDIWALGVIVYKFYHNSLPFTGANNFQIFKCIKQKQPEIEEDTPLDIKQVILSCLKKNSQERPTAQMLKQYSYFKNLKSGFIFDKSPPIYVQEVKKQNLNPLGGTSPTKKGQNEQLFSIVLQKKMFFGNFKPRILTLHRKRGTLYFAYKYVDTKITKNEIQLNMNDYCQSISKNELQINSDDKHYIFRCHNNQDIEKIVKQINSTIRQHFKLE